MSMDATTTPDAPYLEPVGPAARQLGVPVGWLAREIREGRIPHLRAGHARLLHVPTVRCILDRRIAESLPAEVTHAG